MAESLGSACLDLCVDSKTYNREVDNAEKKAQGLDRTFVKIGDNLSAFGDKMTTRVTLPIAAAGAAAFKLAADAAEASSKFEIVMGGAADRVRAGLKELEATIPLTTGEMLGLAAGVQDLLVPMGLARDAGADMSLGFVTLAGDIAAFNDVSPAQVIADIKSGLVGSSEPLFKYGVDTRVAALETVALTNGLIEEGEALTDVTRAQAVMIQLTNQTSDAQGTAAREAENAAQATRFLFRDIKQLGEEIGQVLLPIITPLIQNLREAVQWFRDLSPETQEWAVKIGLVVAAIGPMLSIVGRLLSVGGKIAGMMTVNTAATVANTAANNANAVSLGASGLAKGLGTATLALGAFWAGWKAGEFLADQLGIQENAVANWWDSVREAFGAESVADIRASADAVSQTFGTYRTQAQIAADETKRLADESAALAPAIANVGTATGDAVDPATKYAEAIAALGIVSQEDLDKELNNLALAIESGEVPAETMRPLLDEYRQKLIDLGRISPEVATQLDGLTDSINEQDAAIDGIVGTIPPATNAMDLFGGTLAGLPPVAKATGDSVEDALTRMAAASDTNAFALGNLIAEQQGLTAEQGLALTAYRDNEDQLLIMAEKLRGEWGPAIQEATERQLGLTEAAKEGTNANTKFFEGILGGIPILGEFAKGFDFIGEALTKGIGKINEFVTKGTDFLQEKLTGLFAEGSPIGSFLSDGLGMAVGAAIPFIGPLIAPFVGKLAGLLGKGIKKIGGFFKGLFGGPDAAEKEARETANALNGVFKDMVSSGTAAAEGLTETWQFNNVAQRDIILAMGGTVGEVEGIWNRFQNAAKDPKIAAEFDAFWSERVTKVQSAMQTTGMTLTELRNNAINEAKRLGITVAEAFTAIADGTIATMQKTSQAASTTATKASTDFAAAQQKILADASLSAQEQQKQLVDLSNKHNETMQTMVSDTTTAQNQIASVAVSAAGETERAWVASATRTVEAWSLARRATVGASSIIDIQVLGSDAAKKLGDDQADAAKKTEAEWKRVNRDLALDSAQGGDADRLRRDRDRSRDFAGGDGFRSRGGGGAGDAAPRIIVPVELDGREITRVVIKLTPEIRDRLGI